MKRIRFEVGRILAPHVREILQWECLGRQSLRFVEGRGWFSRVFHVAGDDADVDAVAERIRAYKEAAGA